MLAWKLILVTVPFSLSSRRGIFRQRSMRFCYELCLRERARDENKDSRDYRVNVPSVYARASESAISSFPGNRAGLQIRRSKVTVGRAKLFSIVRLGIGTRPGVCARARTLWLRFGNSIRPPSTSFRHSVTLRQPVELPRFPSSEENWPKYPDVFSPGNAFL